MPTNSALDTLKLYNEIINKIANFSHFSLEEKNQFVNSVNEGVYYLIIKSIPPHQQDQLRQQLSTLTDEKKFEFFSNWFISYVPKLKSIQLSQYIHQLFTDLINEIQPNITSEQFLEVKNNVDALIR